jgi:tetraprenyl-beta-curcumene synthase
VDPREIEAIEGAYFPWIGALHSLLDSLVDRAEDAEIGQLSLVGCYADAEEAGARLRSIAAQATRRARELPRRGGHAALAAGMAALYLSAPEAAAPEALPLSRGALEAAGALVRPSLLVFEVWRGAAAARSALGRSTVEGEPRGLVGPVVGSTSATR